MTKIDADVQAAEPTLKEKLLAALELVKSIELTALAQQKSLEESDLAGFASLQEEADRFSNSLRVAGEEISIAAGKGEAFNEETEHVWSELRERALGVSALTAAVIEEAKLHQIGLADQLSKLSLEERAAGSYMGGSAYTTPAPRFQDREA